MDATDAEVIAQRIAQILGPQPYERPMLTPQGLADRLNLSLRTVRDIIARGVIPSYKVEGTRRIDPRDVDRYLSARKSQDGP